MSEIDEREIKEAARELKGELSIEMNEDVIENTATSLLPATSHYIKSWGYYDFDKKLIIEQITPEWFIYNLDGVMKLIRVADIIKLIPSKKKGEEPQQEIVGKGFVIEGEAYLFKSGVQRAEMFYNVPSFNRCLEFLKSKSPPKKYNELHGDIKKTLLNLFEFARPEDIEVAALNIAQSVVKPLISEFFFYGIDATKGGGKTTLGEIVFMLMRHGAMGGDISAASIPRLVSELDLNIFIDEADQQLNEEDSIAILRKGQRRGNPYVRCEGRDNRPVAYEVAGCHGFSFRSELEDAFMDRALRTHTSRSSNYKLPVINSSKKFLLKQLSDDIFLWFIQNINSVATCSRQRGVAGSLNPATNSRDELYDALTKHLSLDERQFLEGVIGRDAELSYLVLNVSQILGLGILEYLRVIMRNKKEDAASSESYYMDVLRELIVYNRREIEICLLKDGNNAGCPYFPKQSLYTLFVQKLNELKVVSIGTKKFSSMVRDLGFVEGLTLTSQRHNGGMPKPCLIFTEELRKKLFPNDKLEVEHKKI